MCLVIEVFYVYKIYNNYSLNNEGECCLLLIVSFSTRHAFVKVGKFLIGGLCPPNPIENENIKPIIRPISEP